MPDRLRSTQARVREALEQGGGELIHLVAFHGTSRAAGAIRAFYLMQPGVGTLSARVRSGSDSALLALGAYRPTPNVRWHAKPNDKSQRISACEMMAVQ